MMAPHETLRPAVTPLPTSDRLVVLTVVPRGGRGVAPHHSRIAAELRAAISTRTGRSYEVDHVDATHPVANLADYDGVAITVAVSDAPRPTPFSGWQGALQATLESLLPNLRADAPIVVGVPIVLSGAAPHTLRARLAERRRDRVMTEVAIILNGFGRGEFLALPVTSGLQTFGATPGSHDRLAAPIADRLAPRLLQARHNTLSRQTQLSA
jgi:hypothetical protein